MESTKATNNFIQLFEFLPTEETSSADLITVTVSAAHFERDWMIVINSGFDEKEAADVPISGKNTMVRPTQALVFLGEKHAGTIGIGAGQFYDDQFCAKVDDLESEFMNDIRS